MSKSKEIAELLNAEITRTVHLDVMHHEAAAHILAQEAEIERLKITQYGSGRLQALRDERDQARDALRVAVDFMTTPIPSANAGSVLEWNLWCDKHKQAIKQANEVLK